MPISSSIYLLREKLILLVQSYRRFTCKIKYPWRYHCYSQPATVRSCLDFSLKKKKSPSRAFSNEFLGHPELFQRGLHDGVLDGAEHQLDVLGICFRRRKKEKKPLLIFTCGTGEVWIDYLFRVGVQVDEHSKNEFPSGYCILLRTYIKEGNTGAID